MPPAKHHRIVAIPLNREPIISFLKNHSPVPRGVPIRVLGQRPSVGAETEWIERLTENPSVEQLLWRDQPATHLTETTTDRLIPIEYIKEDEEYLSRNLGGWSPVYFGLIEANESDWKSDTLLSQAKVLEDYGNDIKHFGPDPELVEYRLKKEFGTDSINEISNAITRLHDLRLKENFARSAVDMMNYGDKLFTELVSDGDLSHKNAKGPAIPKVLLIDELMGQHVRIELARREFVANGNLKAAADISHWQTEYKHRYGLTLILKGEYVMGRQRRSTVLIAEELGIVAKQPGAEPFHEAHLNANTYKGSPENWPAITGNGEIVTSCGRMRLIIEQGLIIRLNHIFGHKIQCISSLGFIIEPYVSGPTLQEYLLDDPTKLSTDLYSYILMHQLICEELGVENGDWHSANFIVLASEKSPIFNSVSKMVHIDWGAARPLENSELTDSLRRGRLNQVKNIAFSFHDEEMASRIQNVHEEITSDREKMEKLRKMAATIVNQNDLS